MKGVLIKRGLLAQLGRMPELQHKYTNWRAYRPEAWPSRMRQEVAGVGAGEVGAGEVAEMVVEAEEGLVAMAVLAEAAMAGEVGLAAEPMVEAEGADVVAAMAGVEAGEVAGVAEEMVEVEAGEVVEAMVEVEAALVAGVAEETVVKEAKAARSRHIGLDCLRICSTYSSSVPAQRQNCLKKLVE